MAAAPPDELVDQAFDADKHDQLAEAVAKLTPEEAEFFVTRLEAALRKRKIQLFGYLTAMLVWLASMLVALAYVGMSQSGRFVGWVFLIPFGLVGAVLYGFGRWATAVGERGKLAKARVEP
jgi:hypothetical protein